MRFCIFLAAVLAFIVSTAFSANYKFHCRKIPDSCKNGGICETSGLCNCSFGYTGEDCTATTIPLNVTCEPACENNGTCYQETTDSTTGLCACKFGYYGSACEQEIITINCEKDSANYSLSFPPGFDGNLTFVNENGTALNVTSCPVAVSRDGRKEISAIVDISDEVTVDKAACYKMVEEQNISTTYMAHFMVNYDKTVITGLDDIVRLNCTHTREGTEVSSDFTNVIFNSDDLNRVDESVDYSPVNLNIFDKADQPLGSEINIGEKIKLILSLSEDSGYDSLVFLDCTANNTLQGNDSIIFKFLERSCPTNRGKIISTIQQPEKGMFNISGISTSVSGMKVEFYAFKFPNSDQIGVLCTTKVCKAGDDSCSLPEDCDAVLNDPNNEEGNGAINGTNQNNSTENDDTQKRKKRAAADTEQEVSRVFRIQGQNEIRDDKKTDQDKDDNVDQDEDRDTGTADSLEKCMASAEITAVVAVLGAVVCVLLIVCFFLACLLLRRGGKRVTTYDATTLQPISDRFQIPRAHVNESYGEL